MKLGARGANIEYCKQIPICISVAFSSADEKGSTFIAMLQREFENTINDIPEELVFFNYIKLMEAGDDIRMKCLAILLTQLNSI